LINSEREGVEQRSVDDWCWRSAHDPLEAATMTGTIRRLRARDILAAIDVLDPLAVVADDLAGRSVARSLRTGRFAIGDAPDPGLTLVENLDTGERCVLPTACLRMVCAAAVAALAARELRGTGVVGTVALFGGAEPADLSLAVLAAHLPNLSHVAVHAPVAGGDPAVDPAVADRMELGGIGLSVSTEARRTAFGASLCVVADVDPGRLAVGPPAPGVLLVNASGADLPGDVLAAVDQVYVDDLGLLPDNGDRAVGRAHLSGSDTAPDSLRPQREGWHRHQAGWRHHRRVESDLGQVLTGAHPGRAHVDDVVLVDLIGVRELHAALAGPLLRTAIEYGLGEP
jgi:hypothetical protein